MRPRHVIVLGIGISILATVIVTRNRESISAPTVSSSQERPRGVVEFTPQAVAVPGSAGVRNAQQSPSRESNAQQLYSQAYERFRSVRARQATRMQGEVSRLRGLPSLYRSSLLEVRALSMAFPTEALQEAMDALESPSSDEVRQQFALQVLGCLAQNGSRTALDHLEAAARREMNQSPGDAVDILARVYTPGGPSSVLITAAYQGHRKAIEALALYGSTDNITQLRSLKEFLARSDNSEWQSSIATVQDAIQKAEVLQQPEWKASVFGIISGNDTHPTEWLPWAIRVSEAYRLTDSLEPMKQYLLKAEDRELAIIKRQSQDDVGSVEREFASSYSVSGNQYCYDDMLLAYNILGGGLNRLESERLKYFGFRNDPLDALKDLLARPIDR